MELSRFDLGLVAAAGRESTERDSLATPTPSGQPTGQGALLTQSHFIASHNAIAEAFATLEEARLARGLSFKELGLAPSEHFRLRAGTAGFTTLVKVAERLGFVVKVTFVEIPVAAPDATGE